MANQGKSTKLLRQKSTRSQNKSKKSLRRMETNQTVRSNKSLRRSTSHNQSMNSLFQEQVVEEKKAHPFDQVLGEKVNHYI